MQEPHLKPELEVAGISSSGAQSLRGIFRHVVEVGDGGVKGLTVLACIGPPEVVSPEIHGVPWLESP